MVIALLTHGMRGCVQEAANGSSRGSVGGDSGPESGGEGAYVDVDQELISTAEMLLKHVRHSLRRTSSSPTSADLAPGVVASAAVAAAEANGAVPPLTGGERRALHDVLLGVAATLSESDDSEQEGVGEEGESGGVAINPLLLDICQAFTNLKIHTSSGRQRSGVIGMISWCCTPPRFFAADLLFLMYVQLALPTAWRQAASRATSPCSTVTLRRPMLWRPRRA